MAEGADEAQGAIVGSYQGEIDKVKLSSDGTRISILVECDISVAPENTAAWVREIVQNPCYVVIGRYDGLKDIGKSKRGPGRPPKARNIELCPSCGMVACECDKA